MLAPTTQTTETIVKIKAPLFERIDTISGRPRLYQYASNPKGQTFIRAWVAGVVTGKGHWDKWYAIPGGIPASATRTASYAVVANCAPR